MLDVVATLHRMGITHNDIKEDNWVLLATPTTVSPHDDDHSSAVSCPALPVVPWRICLIDFGLTTIHEQGMVYGMIK
jgi:serine/threonine protein kinase